MEQTSTTLCVASATSRSLRSRMLGWTTRRTARCCRGRPRWLGSSLPLSRCCSVALPSEGSQGRKGGSCSSPDTAPHGPEDRPEVAPHRPLCPHPSCWTSAPWWCGVHAVSSGMWAERATCCCDIGAAGCFPLCGFHCRVSVLPGTSVPAPRALPHTKAPVVHCEDVWSGAPAALWAEIPSYALAVVSPEKRHISGTEAAGP